MAVTPLTVRDIVNSESLAITLLAGDGGADRYVSWAHSCEMQDPWCWLGPDELLMTVGLCLPEAASEQRKFIAQLDEAGLAGVVVGLMSTAPDITDEMLDEANLRNFPLLQAAAETPFAAIGRTVAAATATEQAVQVLKLSKMYHLATFAEANPDDLLARLEQLLNVELRVVDGTTGLAIASSRGRVTHRENHQKTNPRSYPLLSEKSVSLEIVEQHGKELDSFLQVHLLKIVDVSMAHLLTAVHLRIEEADQALQQLLNGLLPSDLEALIAPEKLSDGFVLVALSAEHWDLVARSIAILRVAALAGRNRDAVLLLVPSRALNVVKTLLAEANVRGASSPAFTDYRDVSVASTQAQQTLRSNVSASELWMTFEGMPVSVLTRSHHEATEIVRQVLGDLAADDPKTTVLRETLFAFLENDRQWAATAEALSIHRQTLSYRLRRIREITGRDLSSSADLSALWIAYQSWSSITASV